MALDQNALLPINTGVVWMLFQACFGLYCSACSVNWSDYIHIAMFACDMYRLEGIRGIYKGYWATIASFGPFSALYLMFYEHFKGVSYRLHSKLTESAAASESHLENEIPFSLSLLSGASAGALASFLTNPLDIVKLRLQVSRGIAATTKQFQDTGGRIGEGMDFQYKGVVDGLRSILRDDGIPGLFRGAGTRVLFHAPATAITIACFEELKKILYKPYLNDDAI